MMPHAKLHWALCAMLLTLGASLPAQFRANQPPPSLNDPESLPDNFDRLSRTASPEPFLQEIYRTVQIAPPLPQFIGARGASHIYAQPLLGSMHREFAGSTRAFAGRITFIPFCGCQDPANLILSPITLTPQDSKHTDATLRLHTLTPDAQPTPELAVTIHLVRTDKGWRVDDISSARVHSLKLLLRDPPPPTN